MRRTASLIVAGVISAGALAACSGSSGGTPSASPSASSATALTADQYRAALKTVATEEATAQQKVSSAFHATKVTQITATLTGFAADQDKVAGELSALRPPANAVAANAALAAAFKANSAALRQLLPRIAKASSAKKALGIIQNAKGAAQSGRAIDAALTQLKKLGYTKGS